MHEILDLFDWTFSLLFIGKVLKASLFFFFFPDHLFIYFQM